MRNIFQYAFDVFQSRFYELGWRSYVRYGDGPLIHAKIGRHDWHRQFVADPFLFRHDGTNWLFFETLDKKVYKEKLGCFKEVNGKWIPRGIVLEQPWHLSYPQVFEEDGHIYMIPEQSAGGKGDVSLYEATNFPYGWVKRATLIDKPFADSTLLRKDGHYYLACCSLPPNEVGELWHSDNLMGPWVRHPQYKNINQSKRLRRCGGGFIYKDEQLYRVAQDCNGAYGKRVYIVPVLKVSPTEYAEGDARVLLDQRTWPYKFKHTYNEIDVDGVKLSVFDVKLLEPLRGMDLIKSLKAAVFGRFCK